MHTYIHTYMTSGKMADDVLQGIKYALNKIVNTTDQSGNMKKELKKNIYETVSTLRNLVNSMQVMLEEEIRQKPKLKKKTVHTKQNWKPLGGTTKRAS